MIRETIQFLMELKEDVFDKVSDQFGREYFYHEFNKRKLFPVRKPEPDEISISTLNGLSDFYEHDLSKDENDSYMVWVCSPFTVKLIGQRDNAYQSRKVYATSKARDACFRFGDHMSIEKFIIDVNCHFVDSEVKTKLIDAVSHIKASDAVTSDDDGASQIVTKVSGAKLARGKVEKFYQLRPWRTFREIQQPSDKYLLRIHNSSDKNNLPTVSLHSAGGDLWENEAVESIYKYLQIIMPKNIPIIR